MEKDFEKYEYVNVTINKKLAGVCRESYEAFGWEVLEDKRSGSGQTLHMQRPRQIKDRNKLMTEQRKMEDALIAIEEYEGKKTIAATMLSIVTGLLGSGFIIASIIALSYRHMVFFTITEITGIIICALAILVYNRLTDRHRDDYATEIAHLYEDVYEACRQADEIRK